MNLGVHEPKHILIAYIGHAKTDRKQRRHYKKKLNKWFIKHVYTVK